MGYKILLADDDIDLLKMLKSFLTLKSYTVITAENGWAALEKLSEAPDLILLDINMPGLDGLELCKRIRDKVTCPIIFLTARAGERSAVRRRRLYFEAV